MGLFDRVSRLIRANLNSMVSSAEDPEKILEQTVVDMQEDLVQLRQAVAQAIASQKRLEQQYNQNQTQAGEWERRAKLALQKGDETLAREALTRKRTFGETATSLKQQLDQSLGQVDTLKRNMTALESKISEAKTKKEMLTARARAAKASEQINQAMGRVDTTSAMTAFERMEDKVLQLEARSQAIAELAGDSLERQFTDLEAGRSFEEELLQMKAEIASSGQLSGTSVSGGALPPAQTPLSTSQQRVTDAELEQLGQELDRS